VIVTRGQLAAAGAYLLWGLLPIYWKIVDHVPAFEILAHRVVWSAVVLAAVLAVRRDWSWLQRACGERRIILFSALSALLLATNWVVYVWANNSGHMVEASRGYFVNPLVNVVLGLLVLQERLRPGQWLAVLVAATGVAYLVATSQGALWVSLTLAFSFGLYGLLRKTDALGSLQGLSIEMLMLVLPASAYLVVLGYLGVASAKPAAPITTLVLLGGGVVTVTPLLLFAYGARRVPMVTLGILQYFAPTLQFLIGVLVYSEAFPRERLIGFLFVWSALALYTIDGYRTQRRSGAQPSPDSADASAGA
jgi:chloramphenicol-sensitive protein RarD